MTGLFEWLTGATLLEPAWLALVLLVPVALVLRARRGAASVPLPAAALWSRASLDEGAAPRSWRVRLRHAPLVAQSVGVALVAVALARPVERVPLPETRDGLDVLLCLDASSSMTARDLDPERDRLDVARAAAARFVEGRPDDRIGLVRFARYPDVVCPLTLDHAALTTLLEGVRLVPSDGAEDATGIGAAVARAAQLFDPQTSVSKVIVLLTDGEETVATPGADGEIATLHAAQFCEQLGVRVYVIVAGRGRTAPGGATVAIDTTEVELLARRTGGRAFAVSDAASLAAVYDEIDTLERAPQDAPRYRVEERFRDVLASAVLLAVLARLLGASLLAVTP